MKRISKTIFVSLTFILVLANINFNIRNNDEIIKKWAPKSDVAQMPIVHDSAPYKTSFLVSWVEQRDSEYIEFLSSSVKISTSGGSGSGTICYYDSQENWAYVISCGHLWSDNKQYSKNFPKQKAKIITWYHNNTKLEKPKEYEAEVLFYSNKRGYDCSCVRFKPDWKPNYFPIASIDYKIEKSQILNSLGCDGGSEVARYEVEFLEYKKMPPGYSSKAMDLVTKRNGPRPGRSGGGLITDIGWYIGICWGTSDLVDPDRVGFFTPLESIHEVFAKNEHDWIIKMGNSLGRNIPIYDWNNPKNKFEWDFIPIP